MKPTMAKRARNGGDSPPPTIQLGKNVVTVDWVRHRLEQIAETRGTRQKWEEAGLSTIRDFLSGRQKGQYGPTIGILMEALKVAGISLRQFFLIEETTEIAISPDMARKIGLIVEAFREHGDASPSAEAIADILELAAKMPLRSDEERDTFKNVIPLLARRRRPGN